MALTSATNNAVVDLSEENDTAGNQAAGSTNTPESFERSCDNPECSAPRLISLVPKPIASEFVTEPMVVHQPTLINGFTTVFQIDGVGTRMEDIMNESTTTSNNIGGKPKTVFRVVPNTHAHIVNYVVVETAAETMQKIKANDPETMCKLLISQRLSAEQMLKKLIGKALETPSKVQNPPNVPVVPTMQNVVPTPIIAPAPAEASNPKIPPGITMKLLPVREENKTNSSAGVVNPEPNKTTKSTSESSVSRISIKPASQLSKAPSAPASTKATINASSTKKTNPNSSQPTAVEDTSPRPTNSSTRVITASKPVVWQAVAPSSQKNPLPKIAPAISTKTTQPMVIPPPPPPTRISSSSRKTSASLQESELVDVEKAISSTAIAVIRSPMVSNTMRQENALKRKPDTTPVAEAVKRLRPRSPARLHNQSSSADNNVSIVKFSTPIHKKLPTLPKLQQKPALRPILPKPVGGFLLSQKPNAKPIEEKQVKALPPNPIPIDITKSIEPNPPTKLDTPVRRKNKPLMGPASKMKALKAIAEAKAKASQNNPLSTSQTAINTDSGQMKIGETIITRTGSMKGVAKECPKPEVTLTKPCSVAITDIAKSGAATDSDCESLKSIKKSRQATKTTSEKETSNTKNKKANTGDGHSEKLKGRLTVKKEDDKSTRRPFLRATRSMASPKTPSRTAQKPEAANPPLEDISDSTLLTTPSAPSRVLRVVLPSTKNGIVNNPSTSPHPNLKISSVISAGETTLAAPMIEVNRETSPLIFNDDSDGPGIEQLQKELADLRRTVARLTQGKKV